MPAVGERRRFGDKVGEWSGEAWISVPAEESPPKPARFDPSMVAAGPGAIPHGVDVSEAAPVVIPSMLAPFAGAGGVIGLAGTAGASAPAAAGLAETGVDLLQGESVPVSIAKGLGAAAVTKLGGAVLGKVAGKVVERAVGAIAPALRPTAKAIVQHAVLRGAKAEAEAAGKTLTPVAREAAKKTAKTLQEELPDRVVEWATKQKLSRDQIVKTLKEQYGSASFSPGAAGRIVDDILKRAGIQSEAQQVAGAAARKLSGNEKIRAAQAAVAAKGAPKAAKMSAGEATYAETLEEIRNMAKGTGLSRRELAEFVARQSGLKPGYARMMVEKALGS